MSTNRTFTMIKPDAVAEGNTGPIIQQIEKAGFKPGVDMHIALDAASSEFYDADKGIYHFESTGADMTSEQMVDYWVDWCEKYPIISIK